uniref:Adenosine kinase n=1 Tax=Syphacia muris TaxID=451379 RepID=A0A0N5AAD8_9BILA
MSQYCTCGNPLLDYQAHVTKEFLDKWHLIENDAILLDDERASLFDDLEQNFEVQCIPGGATQNAIRVCQWILGVPNCTVFFGAIGNDKYGSVLKQKMLNAGVNVQYQINPTVKTGTCAAMLHDNHRSLCAHLSAANTFTEDHIEIPENRKLIERAKYYYISGFFITSCASAYLKIAKHSAENKKIFMTNLAAPFIPKFYKEVLNEVMPYVDVLFGNESEAAAFAEVFDLKTTDVAEIAKTISKMPMKNSGRQRLVIFTQGADPTYVVSGDTVMKYAVHKLSHSEIVDTNGAGDAFAGGFLAQYIQEKPVEECVCCGHFAAATIIKQNGCTLPAVCGYKS